MCDLKTSSGPRYVQTAAEKCRGVGAFLCVVLGPNSGLTMCKTHPYKTLDPTPFLASSAISQRLGFGMRLARIPCSSARHPSYSALCLPR
jgi:hypothetical protein